MAKKFILICSYGLLLFALLLYSFSQIDLNLTLSSNAGYQSFQRLLIELGYFNRSISTLVFLAITLLLFAFYLLTITLIKRGRISQKCLLTMIASTVTILLLSYPAFSHDIFNYMFDAKIVTTYGQNPYVHKALDFANDPWLRFMHWTHRFFPYGPLWLLITLVPSFLGFGKFVLTLINFKLLLVTFHLSNIALIARILEKENPKKKIEGIAIYALNPLIIIEVLINGHLDVVMLTFAFLGFYFLSVNKNLSAVVSILLSALIKFVTGLFILPFALGKVLNKNVEWVIKSSLILYFLSIIPVVLQREAYPWYLITAVGIFSLLPDKKTTIPIVVTISLGTVLRYAPFLFFGDYNPPVPFIQNTITIVVFLASAVALFLKVKLSKKITP